jgi:hypothetical protein
MKSQLNKIGAISDTEIVLFNKMSSILSLNHNVTFIGKTHGQHVSFHSNTVNQVATREIYDLWIITFSPIKKRARMTFLQAKFHHGPLNFQQRVFSGDYFQYELLSSRPHLSRVIGNRFNFPLNILSFSCCSSIGSYGVFFIDKSNKIDLVYCSAKFLMPQSAPPITYGQSPIHLSLPTVKPGIKYCTYGVCAEKVLCLSINKFTKSLLSLEIGAELIHFPQIISFVQSILIQYQNDNTIKEFLKFSDTIERDTLNKDGIKSDGIPINIFVINTDKKASH